MSALSNTRGYVCISAPFARPLHVRALRSRTFSTGQRLGGSAWRRDHETTNSTRRNVSAASESSSGTVYSTWDALRDELVAVLADLDATSTVLRVDCIVNLYSLLLGCEGKLLAQACSHIAR